MTTRRSLTCAFTLAVSAGATALTGFSGTASAEGSPAQEQINAQLRDYPGGTQTGPDEISYKGGAVTVTFPAGSLAASPCAAGAYCFYDDPDFTGRKLTFRDCGGWQYLTTYGFGNKTASWHNKSKNTVLVHDEDPDPRRLLWTEEPGASSAHVGSAAFNRADSFLTNCPQSRERR